MRVSRERVGDVVKLERRSVDVDPLQTYQEIGIRSFGNGIFHKEPVSGADLGAKRVFRIEPGDLVLSNVFAWEGAIAVATEAERGKIGSHRFMTYVPINGAADTGYLRYFFTSEAGLPLIQRASPGSAGRNKTLAIDRFEDLVIPLPATKEQQRIARHLDTTLSSVDKVGSLDRRGQLMDILLIERSIDGLLHDLVGSGWEVRSLSELASINPRPAPNDCPEVAFVPMSAVDDQTGTIASVELRPATDVRSGYKQFRDGDVIFARITPCMQNGKAAVVRDLPTEFGYGSTEFHVLRPTASVGSDWIHRVVRSRSFRENAASHFKGTAGQQRVPASFLEGASIPVPPSPGDERAALTRIDSLLERQVQLRALRRRSELLARASRLSILNRVFADLM